MILLEQKYEIMRLHSQEKLKMIKTREKRCGK